jgi:hypothetical protein
MRLIYTANGAHIIANNLSGNLWHDKAMKGLEVSDDKVHFLKITVWQACFCCKGDIAFS